MIAIMVKALRMLSSNEKKQLILLLVIIIVTSFVEIRHCSYLFDRILSNLI